MIKLWFDGACKRNGKPDCISAGGVFVLHNGASKQLTGHEFNSTSQRGELQAFILTLHAIVNSKEDMAYVVTDSEYIFNAVTKEWYRNWERKDWVTAMNEPVKNKDLWIIIAGLLHLIRDVECVYYHIKGHVLSIGKVTGATYIAKDPTCWALYERLLEIYGTVKPEKLGVARELFAKNHEFEVDDEALKFLIVGNMAADTVATTYLDNLVAKLEG
jgi:ribonuclease HI